MAVLVLLLCLLIFPSCVLSQVQLKESGPGLVHTSQTLSLTCTVSGLSLTTNSVSWIRRPPGKGLEWLGVIWNKGGTDYNSAFESRLSISRDTSKSQVFLELSSLQPEDTAMYFCARSQGQQFHYFDSWGQGVMVTVSSAPDKEPDMFLFSECKPPNQNEHVKLGCMAIGVQPLTLAWEPTLPSTVFSATNKDEYIMILQISVPAPNLSPNLTCTITNTSKKKSKTFKLPETRNSQSSKKATPTPQAKNHYIEATKPTATKNIVGAMAPSNLNVNILTTSPHHEMSSWLMCEVSGFYPEDIHLWWLSAQTKMDPINFVTAQPVRQSGDKFQIWSVLRLPVALSPSLDTYTCVVEHEASQTKLNASKSLEISGCYHLLPESDGPPRRPDGPAFP